MSGSYTRVLLLLLAAALGLAPQLAQAFAFDTAASNHREPGRLGVPAGHDEHPVGQCAPWDDAG